MAERASGGFWRERDVQIKGEEEANLAASALSVLCQLIAEQLLLKPRWG